MSIGARTPTRARIVVLGVAASAVCVDALTKWWAQSTLETGPVRVVDGFLQFWLTENPGGAFGLFENGGVLLGIVAIGAFAWVIWYSGRIERTTTLVGLGFIAAGAVGNLLDRIFRPPGFLRGDVIDFIKLPNWPTFNLADVYVFVGVALVLLTLVREGSEDDERVKAE